MKGTVLGNPLGASVRLLRGTVGEAVIATILIVTTFVVAFNYLSKTGVSEFYEILFAPAVNFACTGEYQDLDPYKEQLAPLLQFLNRQSETFDCRSLPSNLDPLLKSQDAVQKSTLYLMGSAALIWRNFGVSWAALVPLGAALVALFSVSVYALSRLFVGRLIAIAIVSMATLSPLHISMMHALRDYSKAPFIIASVFLIGATILERSKARFVGYATLAGLVTGVGFGFRSDMILVLPFFFTVAVLAFFIERKHSLSVFAGALALFAAAFFLASGPVLFAGYGTGGIIGHVALLGLVVPFNFPLGVTSTFYDVGGQYLDRSIWNFVNAYYSMRHGTPHQALEFIGADYNRAALQAYLTYVQIFPADILTRSVASLLQILSLDFDLPNLRLSIYGLPGVVLAILALVAVGARRALLAAFFLTFIIFFCGTSSIQFHHRHAFYLELIYWLSLGILVSLAAYVAWTRSFDWRSYVLPILVPAALIVVGAAALLGVRLYQKSSVTTLVRTYEAEPRVPVTVQRTEDGNDVLLTPKGTLYDLAGNRVDYEKQERVDSYFVVSADLANCGQAFSIRTQFIAPSPNFDDSRTYRMSSDGASQAMIFIPIVFVKAEAKFLGFKVHREQEKCIRRIEVVEKPFHLQLPLSLALTDRWSDGPMHQKLTIEPFRKDARHRVFLTNPPFLLDFASDQQLQITPFGRAAWTFVEKNGRATEDGIMFSGLAPYRHGYGAKTKALRLRKGTIVGAVGKGVTGASLNLLTEDNRLAGGSSVLPGRFLSAVEVPQDGVYHVVLSQELNEVLPSASVNFEAVGTLAYSRK